MTFVMESMPIAIVFIAKADPDLDVANPRDVHLTQTGLRKRAYGAHLNGLEAIPLFAVAVITATLRGAPQPWLDGPAGSWLVAGALYTAGYLV